MEKNIFNVLCEDTSIRVSMLNFINNQGLQVYMHEHRKYITDLQDMKICQKWGIFYSHDPHIRCRSLTQEEFDKYTYDCEKNGCLTNCCNGKVHTIILYMRGLKKLKQREWMVTSFSVKELLKYDTFVPDVSQFDKEFGKDCNNSIINSAVAKTATPCTITRFKRAYPKKNDNEKKVLKSRKIMF
tara:strand:- start:5097 stop:5651 length:555 start_codon:yes stop_codon:yes gene_type:complete